MTATTDKTAGRAKQAVGALTDDKATKREGQREETKGKLKSKLDSAVGMAQTALDDLKGKADKA
jgi:uncharacterized protein YjbJ (UPF0337 family)